MDGIERHVRYDEEFFPVGGGGALAGDQVSLSGGDIQVVDARLPGIDAPSLVDHIKLLPRPDGAAVGDQRRGARAFGRDEQAVHARPQSIAAIAPVKHGELLQHARRAAVGRQIQPAYRLDSHIRVVRLALQRDDVIEGKRLGGRIAGGGQQQSQREYLSANGSHL